MRRLVPFFLVALGLTVSPAVFANTVNLYINNYTYDEGAEITAVTSPSFLADYASVATLTTGSGQTGFETFCVEPSLDVSQGTTYSYTLSQSTSLGQNLSLGAAYLYYLFAEGQLGSGGSPSYNYANAGDTRVDDAASLQTAIWALLGEPNLFGQNLATDPYYQFALTTFGANATSANNGAYPVDVMQIWDYNDVGSPADGYQNQLVVTSSVPDGGFTVATLGASFALLALAGCRTRKLSA